MNKREQLVKDIGEKVISELFDQVSRDYNIEYDEYGFDKASIFIQFNHEYGNSQCDVEVSVCWPGGEVECNLYGVESIHKGRYKTLDCLAIAVEEYVADNLDTEDLLDAIKEDYSEACADEWQTHGFASEADYYHWRYG